MPLTLQLKRGLEANRSNYTPLNGELIYCTDSKKLYVGDGTTPGGVAVQAELSSLNANNITTGVLNAQYGGTGISNYTVGNYLRAATTTTLEQRTPSQVLSDIGAAPTSHNHDSVYIPLTQKGTSNGVATLDINGKVPASQLPSYVDDILEFSNYASLPMTGESDKIYITTNDNKIFRWSGSTYVEIASSVGSADVALKLTTPRTIAATGDATWSVSFDGSSNVSSNLVLVNSGVTEGIYTKVTVNSKGLITTGTTLSESDIPNLSATKITTGIISVSQGGTGISNYTVGNYLRAATATTLEQRTPSQVLSDIGAAPTSHNHDSVYIPLTQKGTSNGVATLDINSRIPVIQLPLIIDCGTF